MIIATVGLWHLGSVTTACLAAMGFDVIAYDTNETIVVNMQQGKLPVFEPGLDDLMQQGVTNKKLCFTSNPQEIAGADIVWITFDTPVDDDDHANVEYVINEVEKIFPFLKNDAIVLISSQLPVGSTRKLQESFIKQQCGKNVSFTCLPENLRLGKAIEIFTNPDRIIVGIQREQDKQKLEPFLNKFSTNILWMSPESAEMTKHALNAFLATSVVFINELATLCETVGANAREVELGLKSEERIGRKAYLRPGNAIAGGTLARDINYLIAVGKNKKKATPLFSALLDSNQIHKQWSCHKIAEIFKDLKCKTIALLGLTYKDGTDALRRSAAIEMCQWLHQQGAEIAAYDPAITTLPKHLASFIQLRPSLQEVLTGSDAAVVTTECPQFAMLTAEELIAHLNQPVVLDANGFLLNKLGNDKRLRYFSVGNSYT